MVSLRLALAAVAVVLVAGCSSGGSKATAPTVATTIAPAATVATTTTLPAPKETVEAFVKRHLTEEADGQWGLAYVDLIPRQQAAITRDLFIMCGDKVSIPQITNVSVVKVFMENTPTPGVGDLDSTAVTIKVTIQGGQSETQTVHAYNVNGVWRAAVDQAHFDAESKGQCPP